MVGVLAVHDRLTLCCTGAVPVPVTDSATGPFVALLVNEKPPEVAPLAFGLNLSVNVALCPGPRVTGNVKPVNVNSALLEETDEIVTPDPVALNVPVCV